MENVMLPLDFYNIEQNLTDEEKLVQETAGKFVDREVLPIIRLGPKDREALARRH